MRNALETDLGTTILETQISVDPQDSVYHRVSQISVYPQRVLYIFSRPSRFSIPSSVLNFSIPSQLDPQDSVYPRVF